jgi:exonuclease SbcD
MANYGRHDPGTGLPLRVLDFLKSLDVIVDTAINEGVDLVLFAGDAYKDRSPAPTFQREWGKRIMRLSQARIPTLLLIGNHDISPAIGRAHSVQEFETLQVPLVRVLHRPELLGPSDLWDLPIQILALPWISRSALMASLPAAAEEPGEVSSEWAARVSEVVQSLIDEANPSLPLVLTAHASVEGAIYGSERAVMLGRDLVLPSRLVRNPRFDYVALGHIHKPQDLNEGSHPPVIYPGSIERVDFGEAQDDKYFVIADVAQGDTHVRWMQLEGVRPFVDRRAVITSEHGVNEDLQAALQPQGQLSGAIVRLAVEYPRELESLIDEPSLRRYAETAFEFHLVKRPHVERRARLSPDQVVGSLTPMELLDLYWQATKMQVPDGLRRLAQQIIGETDQESGMP